MPKLEKQPKCQNTNNTENAKHAEHAKHAHKANNAPYAFLRENVNDVRQLQGLPRCLTASSGSVLNYALYPVRGESVWEVREQLLTPATMMAQGATARNTWIPVALHLCWRHCGRRLRRWWRRIHHGHVVWRRQRNGDRGREVFAWRK